MSDLPTHPRRRRPFVNFVERVLEVGIFNSRWLMAPFYIGLGLALIMLMCVFVMELVHGVPLAFSSPEEAILLVLSLIDLSLAGNLILIVTFSGYENFVSNELEYQDVVPALKATTKPGGVYIGVGPEQNFTYVAVLQSRLAFVIDIRRQNMVELLLYKALKRCTRRPRPFARDGRIRAWVAPLDEFSFPSGHTLHAVAFTLVALAWFPALWWLLIPFSASVAVSRVVLGLHYPSDVVAATAIGIALAGASLQVVPGVALL